MTRRISFPEARSRIVAAVLTPDDVPGEWFAAALELNVLTLPSGSSPDAAWGLALWLASTAADRCVRPTLGSTHVNGSDLESLPCPPVDVLAELGASVRDHVTLGRAAADCAVERCLPWLSAEPGSI